MEPTLKLISGVCWSAVYISLIYHGFKHKSYGMPFVALALNLSWEAIYSFYQFDPGNISLQRGINLFWLGLDLVIVYQYFAFGKKHFPVRVGGQFFIPWSLLVLLLCFAIEYMFLEEFGRSGGAKYSAFLQNLLMSFLFIDQLYKRANAMELSKWVAVLKWAGTLAPTILFGMENDFILAIGLMCCVVDLIYIYLLFDMRRKVSFGT